MTPRDCMRHLRTRFQANRQVRLLRLELLRRGSSDASYRLAATCGPASAEAAKYVDESIALGTLEGQLARLRTETLRRRMRRRKLALPDEPACWMRGTVGGVLTAHGVAAVEDQLREGRRVRIAWRCLWFVSMGLVAASVIISFWPF